MSRHRKTEQTKIPAVCNFERLRCVNDCDIPWSANLLVATLSVATDAIELKIDKAQIADASGYVGAQTENRVLCRFDMGNLDRSNVSSRYLSLERLLADFPRFQLNESRG
jgi:hypothetical protein